VVPGQFRVIRVRFLPSPIVGDTILVHEGQINKTRVGRPFGSIGSEGFIGPSAVAAPAVAAVIFVLVGAESLEDRSRSLKDGGNEVCTLLRMAEAAPTDRVHAVE